LCVAAIRRVAAINRFEELAAMVDASANYPIFGSTSCVGSVLRGMLKGNLSQAISPGLRL
jgi:hypothetical protein